MEPCRSNAPAAAARLLCTVQLSRTFCRSLPEARQPTMHLFYRHRIIDVADALVKYLDGWDGPQFVLA